MGAVGEGVSAVELEGVGEGGLGEGVQREKDGKPQKIATTMRMST